MPPHQSSSFSEGGRSGASTDDDDDDEASASALAERRQRLVAASLLQQAAAAVPVAVQGYLVFEQQIAQQQGPGRLPYLDEERHRQRFLPPRPTDTPVTWRLKERMKVGVRRLHDD